MVKQMNVWKFPWFKNDTKECGAMNVAIEKAKPNDIIVHSLTTKYERPFKIWTCIEPTKYLELIKENKGLYEVINKFPHKLYFDIDKENLPIVEAGEYLERIKTYINMYFPNAVENIAVSGSITETKTSYHLVSQNYMIKTIQEQEIVKSICKYLNSNVDDGFDWKVYTSNRNMKSINQSKPDGRVQCILENDDPKNHLITCFFNDSIGIAFQELPFEIKEEIEISKSKATFDLGLLPKVKLMCPENFNYNELTAKEILNMLHLNKSYDHNYTHLVARFCYYNNLTFADFLGWISKKHNPLTQEKADKWKSNWDRLHKFPEANFDKMKTILCTQYPNLKKDKTFRSFSDTFLLPTEKIINIETISQAEFKNKAKFLLFNIGMGGGKTYQTIEYLKNCRDFVWICPNKALSYNTQTRLEQSGVDISHYLQFKADEKRMGALNEKKRLIIVLNSLHYYTEKIPDVVVIDEIETLLDKFLGDFIENKKEIWTQFVRVISGAKKVIFLDAFITTKTINFIKSIPSTENTDFVIFKRILEPTTRTIKYIEKTSAMIMEIIQKVKNGSKCFIFYPYKQASNDIIGMETLFNMITKESGQKGVFYHADVSEKTKKGLKNVNESWSDYKFVLTNSIITCGINYENEDFDYAYIFTASFNTPRDIIQVSYRARFLSTGLIKVNFLGKMNQTNSWKVDTKEVDDVAYTALIENLLIEKKSPLKQTLQLFCVKAHYKQIIENVTLTKEMEQFYKKLLDENINMGYSYNTIKDINPGDAEHIIQKIFTQTATMNEKIRLKKYYFKLEFTKEAEEVAIKLLDEEIDAHANMLQYAWDEKFTFFLNS